MPINRTDPEKWKRLIEERAAKLKRKPGPKPQRKDVLKKVKKARYRLKRRIENKITDNVVPEVKESIREEVTKEIKGQLLEKLHEEGKDTTHGLKKLWKDSEAQRVIQSFRTSPIRKSITFNECLSSITGKWLDFVKAQSPDGEYSIYDHIDIPPGIDPTDYTLMLNALNIAFRDNKKSKTVKCPKCTHKFRAKVSQAELEKNSVAVQKLIWDKKYPNLKSVEAKVDHGFDSQRFAVMLGPIIAKYVSPVDADACFTDIDAALFASGMRDVRTARIVEDAVVVEGGEQ